MGKNLKGRNCGRGICQRKDGYYVARLVIRNGKRITKYFKTLPEARNWLEDMRYNNRHGLIQSGETTSLSEWFSYYMDNLCSDLATNTKNLYTAAYYRYINEEIGDMKLSQIKQMHCQRIVNKLLQNSIEKAPQTVRSVLNKVLSSAVNNQLINSNPAEYLELPRNKTTKDTSNYLTTQELAVFYSTIKGNFLSDHWSFVLETGLRCGELLALTWRDVDWDKRLLYVRKSLNCPCHSRMPDLGAPKSASGYRVIPLTSKAYQILLAQKERKNKRKEGTFPDGALTFEDPKTGISESITPSDLIFLGKNGLPVPANRYNYALSVVCKKAGIKKISIHSLRHTYATNANNRGVPIKQLQMLLGHATSSITMDFYIHSSEETLRDAVSIFEGNSLGQDGTEMVQKENV